MKRSYLFPAIALALTLGFGLGACAVDPHATIKERPHYWQRVSASDQTYLQGPKAQQMLDRDIGRCVTELRELERLGIVRDAIPADAKGHILNSEEHDLAKWDTPDRDGELLNEHLPYTDFEGCMYEKGWERIKYVPFKVAAAARETYLKTHGLLTEEKKEEQQRKQRQEFGNLNE